MNMINDDMSETIDSLDTNDISELINYEDEMDKLIDNKDIEDNQDNSIIYNINSNYNSSSTIQSINNLPKNYNLKLNLLKFPLLLNMDNEDKNKIFMYFIHNGYKLYEETLKHRLSESESKKEKNSLLDENFSTELFDFMTTSINKLSKELSNKIQSTDDYIDKRITNLVKESTDKLSSNIIQINNAVDRITGVSYNSSIKGKVVEKSLEEFLLTEFKYSVLENTSKLSNCGDFILSYNNIRIIIESKAYINDVDTTEINKLKLDMIKQNINYGVIISFTSSIAKHSVFDIESIDDKHIIFISNPNNKFSNEQLYNEVSLAIRILSILSTKTNNISVNINKDKISECADKFRNVISNMSKLRINMSNIKKEVDQTIILLNEMEISFKQDLSNITQEVQSCIEFSEWKQFSFPYWLSTKQSDKKKYNIYYMIYDVCESNNIKTSINTLEDQIALSKDNINLGYIKLLKSKTSFIKECDCKLELELSDNSRDMFIRLINM